MSENRSHSDHSNFILDQNMKKLEIAKLTRQLVTGHLEGRPTLLDGSQKFWPLVDVFFSQKGVFFEIL